MKKNSLLLTFLLGLLLLSGCARQATPQADGNVSLEEQKEISLALAKARESVQQGESNYEKKRTAAYQLWEEALQLRKAGKIDQIPSGTQAAKDHVLEGAEPGAQAHYDKIRAEEKRVTVFMIDLAERCGGILYGLPWSVKTGRSVMNKVAREKQMNPDLHDTEIVQSFGDLLRYTILVQDHDSLLPVAKTVLAALKKKKMRVLTLSNKYTDPEKLYKDIKLYVQDRKGVKFEVQIHSWASSGMYEKTHVIYEMERDVNTKPAVAKALKDYKGSLWQTLPSPKNIGELKSFGL